MLVSAVRGRHKDLVLLLLMQPVIDCNVTDKYGRTPLIVAARAGYKDIVEILVNESSVDLNAVDEVIFAVHDVVDCSPHLPMLPLFHCSCIS